MKNIDKVKALFLDGKVQSASNSKIRELTGIKTHQQVFIITRQLVEENFLEFQKEGKEKIFFLSDNQSSQSQTKITSPKPEPIISSNPQNEDINLIKNLGFVFAGEWVLVEGELDYKINLHRKAERILYAFISNDEILYVGKSIRSLQRRMYNYKNPGPTQPTNQKNHGNIIRILKTGKTVKIYAFAPKADEMVYRNVPVNLAAGLEDSLISIIKPSWNNAGK